MNLEEYKYVGRRTLKSPEGVEYQVDIFEGDDIKVLTLPDHEERSPYEYELEQLGYYHD